MPISKPLIKYSEVVQWGIATLGADKVGEIVKRQGENGEIEVYITINGIEVDFEEIVQSIEEQYEQAVENHAREIFSKNIEKLTDKITDDVRSISEAVEELEIQLWKEVEIKWKMTLRESLGK